jgi:hypothetical protein
MESEKLKTQSCAAAITKGMLILMTRSWWKQQFCRLSKHHALYECDIISLSWRRKHRGKGWGERRERWHTRWTLAVPQQLHSHSMIPLSLFLPAPGHSECLYWYNYPFVSMLTLETIDISTQSRPKPRVNGWMDGEWLHTKAILLCSFAIV